MFPGHLFDLFPPFPRDNRVLVAMSFDQLLEPRWRDVIEPGVKDAGLEAYRVNASKISDSIVTDIVKGVASARLVLADISTVGVVRNANVLYEVGLAHAVRQPQEVLLFRSDSERLLFDLSTVRVNAYDPDRDPVQARRTVAEAVSVALKEVEVQKSLAVDRAVKSLDAASLVVLGLANAGGMKYPEVTTVGEMMGTLLDVQALNRLLAAGLVQVEYLGGPIEWPITVDKLAREKMLYRSSPLGAATLREVGDRLVHKEGETAPLPKEDAGSGSGTGSG
jgi:hypothetical protein